MQAGEHSGARNRTMKLVDSGRVLNGAPQFVGRPKSAGCGRVDRRDVPPARFCGRSRADLLLERQSAALLPLMDDAACSTSSGSSLYATFPSSHRSSSSSRVSAAVHLQRPRLSTRNKARCSLVRARELSFLASWNARSHLIPLVSSLRVKGTQVRKTGVQASLLGVGAPEVLVIGVVALLVFGPKGLAEVARTLGNSLRAFQPTIRELQQVSKEFKSTLEQEIGLDELSNPSQAPTSTPLSPFQQPTIPFKEEGEVTNEPRAYTTEDYLRMTEEQAKALVPEEQCEVAEAQGGQPPLKPVTEVTDQEVVQQQEGSKDRTPVDEVENVNQSSSLKL